MFLASLPLVAVIQQTTILLVAAALNTGSRLAEAYLLPNLPINPVYGGAGLRMIGGIEPRGLAVAGWPGQWLHAVLPAIFHDPSLVADLAIVSGLVEPVVTLLASLLAVFLATSLLIASAEWLAGVSVGRLPRHPLMVAVRLGQIWLLLNLASETNLSLRELEATGIPFALAAFTPVDQYGQRVLITTQLQQVPGVLVAAVNVLAGTISCLALAWLLLKGSRGLWALLAGRTGPSYEALHSPIWAGLLASVAVVLTLSPVRSVTGTAIASTPVPLTEFVHDHTISGSVLDGRPAGVTADDAATGHDESTRDLALTTAPLKARGRGVAAASSRVTLEGSNYHYLLRANGQPWVVRGVGYNPWYAERPPEERQALYRRDFSLMRETGINTVQGWFHRQFDDVTLDEAHRHGLKVIMPFELDQDADYADAEVQARYRAEVTEWVLRYRDHPAVLMWAPGNEVLHRIISPTVIQSQLDQSRGQRADAFAAFLVELIDLIHQVDPNHPVIYRDAEDLYLSRFATQIQRQPAARPWLVYGTNVYTSRVAEIIEHWPHQGIDAALLVSEFAPGGASDASRPQMLSRYWSMIRAQPERVLGGVVYAWAARGPEDLDRVFGLTDDDGRPVDGSLEALRRLFRPAGLPAASRPEAMGWTGDVNSEF